MFMYLFFFFQAEDGIRDKLVTGVQTCALPIFHVEGGYLYFLTRIDVDDSIAVTLGLLWFALTVLAGLVGGALFVASGAALPRVQPRPAAPADVSAAGSAATCA